jgi:hypothetical protein
MSQLPVSHQRLRANGRASAAADRDRDDILTKTSCQNSDDLVREAVGCKHLLGRLPILWVHVFFHAIQPFIH